MSQNVSPIAERSWLARERVAGTATVALPIALLALCAVLLQARLGADADVHWLTDLAGRWLDGQVPYVDFIENNPPASILLYVFPAALARALHLRPDAVTQACAFSAVAIELAVAAAAARSAGLTREFGGAGLFWCAAALILLPGFAFAQRDHLALVLAAPMFVVLSARAVSRPIEAHWAIAGGLGAGCMICLRPHYALALAPPALYALCRRGWRGAERLPEILSCTLVLAVYGATVLLAFPHFVSDILPIDLAIHARVRAPFNLLLVQIWFLVWLSLAAALWGTRRALIASVPAQLLALASAGALASYLVQGKGWAYHLYVADALIVASFAIANRMALRQTGLARLALALALAAASALLVTAFFLRGETLFLVLRYSLLPALAVSSVWLVLKSPDDATRTTWPRWMPLSVVVLGVAAGEMAMLDGAHRSYFPSEAAALGPQPSFALVAGTGVGAGIDLASQTNGTYPARAFAMDILEVATDRLRQGGLPPETEVALNRYIREDRERLAATVRQDRPDAIVVDPDWARLYLEPAFLHDLLDGYRLRATTKLPARFMPMPRLQLYTRDSAR